jgi:hypothetical protein
MNLRTFGFIGMYGTLCVSVSTAFGQVDSNLRGVRDAFAEAWPGAVASYEVKSTARVGQEMKSGAPMSWTAASDGRERVADWNEPLGTSNLGSPPPMNYRFVVGEQWTLPSGEFSQVVEMGRERWPLERFSITSLVPWPSVPRWADVLVKAGDAVQTAAEPTDAGGGAVFTSVQTGLTLRIGTGGELRAVDALQESGKRRQSVRLFYEGARHEVTSRPSRVETHLAVRDDKAGGWRDILHQVATVKDLSSDEAKVQRALAFDPPKMRVRGNVDPVTGDSRAADGRLLIPGDVDGALRPWYTKAWGKAVIVALIVMLIAGVWWRKGAAK